MLYTVSVTTSVFVPQMQFLVSRLASPTVVDFDEDGRNDTRSVGGQITLQSSVTDGTAPVDQQQTSTEQQRVCTERYQHTSVPLMTQPQRSAQKSSLAIPPVAPLQDFIRQQHADCAERLCHASVSSHQSDSAVPQAGAIERFCQGTVGQQRSDSAGKSCCIAAQSDTESTVSLNELLDGCQYDTDAGVAYAVDSCDAEECPQLTAGLHCGTDECSQPTLSLHCEAVKSVDPVAVHSDGNSIAQTSVKSPPRLALDSPPSRYICKGAELTEQNESSSNDVLQSSCQTTASPLMQRSFAESNVLSLTCVDDGYHSNATSAMLRQLDAAVSDVTGARGSCI